MLSDCISRDPAVSELLIVQASFVPSVKQGRDRMTQAVLSIRPSIIKVEGADFDQVLDCEEIKSIIASLGVGIWLPEFPGAFNIGALRYGKLILWTDGTPDGRHIRDQLYAFFVKLQRPLLEAGRVYEVPEDWTGEVMMVSESGLPMKGPQP